ncbi:MAG: hypothetical protein U1V55_17405 [Planktothrix rubescens PR222]|jgi:hypothetical protein
MVQRALIAIGAAIAAPLAGLLSLGGIGLTGGITIDVTLIAITIYVKTKG